MLEMQWYVKARSEKMPLVWCPTGLEEVTMSDIVDRFLPPKCEDVHDWITLMCFIFTGFLLTVWIIFLVFKPEYSDAIFKILLVVGSFAVGRVSIIIAPRKNRK